MPSDELPEITTTNDFTEEHKLLKQMLSEFMEGEVVPHTHEIESKSALFQQMKMALSKLAELGILGAEVPEEYGGQAMDKISGAIIAEIISAYGHGSFATTVLAHTGIGTLPILLFGTEEQKRKYLPDLVAGKKIGAYSLSEVDAGSDANAVKAKAVKSEDGTKHLLNGEKKFVTNGGFANIFTVFAKLEGSGLTAFIVEDDYPGAAKGKEEHKMGIQGSSTVELIFKDAEVPVGNLLGEPGKGFKIAVTVLNFGRFKLGAACLGGGRYAFKKAFNYAKERKQFKQPIVNFKVIRHKLARMSAKLYAMESIIYRTAGLLSEPEAGKEFAAECSVVKVACSEMLDHIVDENVQIHGGSGFCEGDPERQYRDSRINRIFEGTNEINTILIPGMILKSAFEGKIPLIAAAKKLQGEILSPSLSSKSQSEDLMEELFKTFCNYRKAVLLASAVNVEKWMAEAKGNPLMLQEVMNSHQIPVYLMGQCMIDIYVVESILAALARNRNELDDARVKIMFNEVMPELERLTREMIVMACEVDTQMTYLAALRRFTKFTPYNMEQLCDFIVKELIKGA